MMHLNRFFPLLLIAWSVLGGAPIASAALLPTLRLTGVGGVATSGSIPQGTASFAVDVHFDSATMAVSTLQYRFAVTPAAAVTFGADSVVALGAPFTAGELAYAPPAGTAVDGSQIGATTWLKSSAGDYAAFDAAIARQTFDTAALPQGTYVFTPLGDEVNNSTAFETAFGEPGTFTLVVTPVPEPAALGLVVLGAATLRRSRERRSLRMKNGPKRI